MIARRLGAAGLALLLIAGAWLLRDRVIEDDRVTPGDEQRPADVLVCASELRELCRDVASSLAGELTVTVDEAGDTLDQLAAGTDAAPLWLTFDRFPQMLDTLRSAARVEPITYAVRPLARSPLAVVSRADSTASLTESCGDPIALACLADRTDLSPTFAPLQTATGMLAVAAAVASYGSGATVDLGDVQFLLWARRLEAAGARSLSGGTAVQTIQTRPTFAVAVGAEAELNAARRDAFDVLYADPVAYLDVVLVVPDGVDPPSGLADSLADGLLAAGWQGAEPSTPNGLPDPGIVLAVRDFWEDLG